MDITMSNCITVYPIIWNTSGLPASTNYIAADYELFIFSYNPSVGNASMILRTNTGSEGYLVILTRTDVHSLIEPTYNTNNTIQRSFALVSDSATTPARIHDMMIFPGEYMSDNSMT